MQYESPPEPQMSPLDMVGLRDFLDSGIRLGLTANRTLMQVRYFGLEISTIEFYAAWNKRRNQWKNRKVA